MALNLTENLRQAIKSTEVTPVLVAKIDGFDTIFGNVEIQKFLRIGDPDFDIGNEFFIGGFRILDDQAAYISFSQGTTTRIAQKIDPSRGQSSSVSQMSLALLDVNQEISNLVSPGFVLSDVIGRRVTIFLGIKETSWPEDYNVVFRGVIQDVESSPTTIFLNLASTDDKKRQSILPRINSESAQPIDFRSATFQDLQFINREDVVNLITVTYITGGTAGSENVIVTGGGFDIQVQIQDGASTAAQIRKAIENDPEASQLVSVKITGESSDPQFIGTVSLSVDNTIDLLDASEFILPENTLQTYVRVGDELMQYTGIAGNTLTGVTRAQNNSLAMFHNVENSVDQVVRITGNAIDIALKLMLSKGPEFYLDQFPVQSFQYFSPSISLDNAIFIQGTDLQVDHGVSAGDLVTIIDATNPANNITNSIILEVGSVDDGSFIIVSENLADESTTTAKISFKSQFNVLPIGFAMIPAEVDVAEHLRIRDTFLPVAPLDLFLNEISDGKGFLERQVYLGFTCFSVPRKGRSSLIYTVGPLPSYEIVTLNTKTVENPEALRVKRSSTENFFNQVQYDYDFDPVSGQYLTRKNYPQEVDQTQIPVGVRPFLIEAQGFTTADGAGLFTEQAANRLLRRYERGAEFIKGIKPLFSVGYQLEIGDVVAIDYADLQLTDFSSGNRQGVLKLMEIQNKILDNKTGEVTIDVVNTIFGASDRYGLISPASETLAGSTTSKLILAKSWSTKPFEPESKKWNGYLNQKIIVHSPDWTFVYPTLLRGFDNNDPQGMSIDPIPMAPGADWIVQCPEYPSSLDQNELAFWKQRHAFFSPRVPVTAGITTTRFTVDPLEVGRFFIGSVVRVHNYDFTVDSPEVVVTDIIGNDIIVGATLGFIPTSDEVVDLIGFPDKQQSYRVV